MLGRAGPDVVWFFSRRHKVAGNTSRCITVIHWTVRNGDTSLQCPTLLRDARAVSLNKTNAVPLATLCRAMMHRLPRKRGTYCRVDLLLDTTHGRMLLLCFANGQVHTGSSPANASSHVGYNTWKIRL